MNEFLIKHPAFWTDLIAMISRNRRRRGLQPEDLIKVALGILLPISIAVGGATGFMPLLDALILVFFLSMVFAAIAVPPWLGWKMYRRRQRAAAPAPQASAFADAPAREHLV